MTQELLVYVAFWPNTSRNSVAIATPKVPSDQKQFDRVYCTLISKVTKFQLPTPNSFCAVLKKTAEGEGKFASPVQNRVKCLKRSQKHFHTVYVSVTWETCENLDRDARVPFLDLKFDHMLSFGSGGNRSILGFLKTNVIFGGY